MRDIDQDRKVHKKTLAVRFGKSFSKIEYVGTISLAALIPIFLFYFCHVPVAILFSSTVVFFAYPLMKKVEIIEDAQLLNAVLEKTGKLTLLFGVLFSLGLIL
jgi:1,4-dihydroxy-2-naphthoate polyprenyltransferase